MDEIGKSRGRIGPLGSLKALNGEFSAFKVGVSLRETLAKQVVFSDFG